MPATFGQLLEGGPRSGQWSQIEFVTRAHRAALELAERAFWLGAASSGRRRPLERARASASTGQAVAPKVDNNFRSPVECA